MIRTRVGYAGGTSYDPTYYNLEDHSETVQIDFDPAQISYEELLSAFWSNHVPTLQPWSRQYMSVIFYHNEEQKSLAQASLQQEESRLGKKIYTEIIPFREFYLAEDYHQKYYLRGEPELFSEYAAIYPETGRLIQSTAAARVNGYLGGNGDFESLQKQVDSLGLSAAGMEKLLEIGRHLLSVSD